MNNNEIKLLKNTDILNPKLRTLCKNGERFLTEAGGNTYDFKKYKN